MIGMLKEPKTTVNIGNKRPITEMSSKKAKKPKTNG